MAGKQKPPRPTIALPPRPSVDYFGGLADSPGPMTLVSSFFSSDSYPEQSPDFRSFSQLLAGAMNSPLFVDHPTEAPPATGETKSGDVIGVDKSSSGFKQNRPMTMSLAVARSPLFTVPSGLSPSGLLCSPGLFSCQSPFGMSHQQALAQVTAQASLTQSYINTNPNSQPQNGFASEPAVPSDAVPESSDMTSSSMKNKAIPVSVDKPAEDGYNWRKYGQKQVKGCEYPRSYYKCTHLNCPVKKKVERSLDGRITEIVYNGQHSHNVPQPNRRSKENNSLIGSTHSHAMPEVKSVEQMGNPYQIESEHAMTRREQELSQVTTQVSVSSDNEEVDDRETLAMGDDGEPHPKRRNLEVIRPLQAAPSTAHKTITEPKIVVQTRSEVDLLDDGYRWRKYGQKVVKGNPHPRSYYKCTFAGCNVRKHVERAAADPKAVVTTYEGKHNHGVPGARGSSHSIANANQVSQPNQQKPVLQNHVLQQGTGFRGNNQRPTLLQLKAEEVAS